MAHKLDNMKAQRLVAGHDSVTTLAKKANVSDATIKRIEDGEGVEPHVSQRIADALGVSLATLGKRDV